MTTQSTAVVQIDDLLEARRVLELESNALIQLSENLGVEFSKAVMFLYESQGRVIVTGMGKSGHVGRKISATLSSTGSPSFFVHPAEASHGDLGRITENDVIIALSNSGETSELSDILAFSRRYKIKLIGITTNGDSTLARTCDVALVLPKSEEACPLGLAPTTSTTLMMALGDALATATLKRRGFSKSDFKSLHPGGNLGQRLMRVDQLMHTRGRVPTICQSSNLKEAILEMTSKGFGCVAVLDDEQNLVGIITDGDLRRHLEEDLLKTKVQDIMTLNPRTIESTVLAQEALARMNEYSITSLFVTQSAQDQQIVGIIHIHDCLRIGLA